ncbi:MAG: DUF1186 domain-containing protein [Chloroherpetonaceae bacterium]|nr:DUF1186 domain-containing protein [Chloroherpetonaceae bacterium]
MYWRAMHVTHRTTSRSGRIRQPAHHDAARADLLRCCARLRALGPGLYPEVYQEVAEHLCRTPSEGVSLLIGMALEAISPAEAHARAGVRNPHASASLHAVRTLECMGDHARSAIEPLLPLLDADDDELREQIPVFYGVMGRPAVASLARVLRDSTQNEFLRGGAAGSLAEIANRHPETRNSIVAILEEGLEAERSNPFVAAEIICALLDVGARQSLGVIRKAFAERRVDETLVEMRDVEEYFGLREPRIRVGGTRAVVKDPHAGAPVDAAQQTEKGIPFVKGHEVGRNAPCPCGSGKKYKKCCGQ